MDNKRAQSGAGDGQRRPRVVFVNRFFAPDESATSRMLSELAFRLSARGVSVSVVTSRQLYGNARASLPASELLGGVAVHRVLTASRGRARLAGRAMDYVSFHVAARLKLRSLLSPGDVVVAKTDPPLISIAVAAAARRRKAVLVNWLQDLFPEVASALTPALLPEWLEKGLARARDRSLEQALMNVVLSEGMRNRLLARGIDSARIRVVPNWANVDNVTPLPAGESRTRRQRGLERRFVVGYSGNLGRAHDFQTLLGAARALREDRQFAFLITGAGAKAGGLRRQVQQEGLKNFVFQDYAPPELLSDSLAASDVHLVSLLPKLEGLIVPSKIYGIFAAGRPTAYVGDTGGDLARMLRDRDCGIAVGIGECERLARELTALRDNPSRLESMGRNARQLAVGSCTSEHAVAQWVDFLDAIAPGICSEARPAAAQEVAPLEAGQVG